MRFLMQLPSRGVAAYWLLSAFSLSVGSSHAQTTAEIPDQSVDEGIRAYQAYHISDIDSVNLQNGNLTVKIPLFSLPQRGTQTVSYFLLYNAKQLKPTTSCNININNCIAMMQLGPSILPLGLSLRTTADLDGVGVKYVDRIGHNDIGNYTATITPVIYTADSTGAQHEFANITANTYRSIDGSGFQAILTSPGNYNLIHPNGTTNYDGSAGSGCSSVDANGNELCSQDTVGRPWSFNFNPLAVGSNQPGNTSGCTGTLPTTATSTISVPGVAAANGGVATYKACYATVSVVSMIDLSGDTPPQYSNKLVMQSLVLPDNTAWTFAYESGSSNLTQITTPSGGIMSYTWGVGGANPPCFNQSYNESVVSKSVNSNDGTGWHNWSYSWSAGSGSDWSVTVTDPNNNDTVTNFVPVYTSGDSCVYYPHIVTSYQGSASANQVLKSVDTEYNTLSPQQPDNSGTAAGVYPVSITTTMNGSVSQVQMDYDSGFTASQYNATGVPEAYFTALYGKVISKREYDFGTGKPGSLLRTTNIDYLAFDSASYLNANFMNAVSSVTVLDGLGVQRSKIQYGYDESSTVPSGITTQHVSPPGGSYIGNQTSVRTWLTGSTPVATISCTPNFQQGYLVTTKTYFDTGEVQQTTDACGHPSSYQYDPAYSGAYQTSVTTALGTTTKTYDINTGQVINSTDLNGQVTIASYDDPFGRITDLKTPQTFNSTRGETQFTYTPNTVQINQRISDAVTRSTLATIDGSGRLTSTALTNDPSGPDYVNFGYDGLGHETTTSNPTRCQTGGSCNESTAGTTQHVFDALGREIQLVPPDGTTSSNYVGFAYSGNSVVTTDQAGVSSQYNTDVLGRVTGVYETNMGWLTNYTYDVLGNLLCVEQHGNASGTGCSADPSQDATSPWRVRRFTYDSLSRLITASNPEAGLISYTYDADGKVITKTDARGITTTYKYDNVDRLIGKTYSNGDPAVTYGYDAHSSTNFGIGRRTSMTDASGSTTWTYDQAGRETSETRTIGSVTKTVGTAYFLNGSPYQITYPSGDIVTYTPQAVGQISAVSDTLGNTFASNIVYNPTGVLSTGTLGSAITLTDSYDSRLQPSLLQASTPSKALMSLGYDFGLGVYDNGNLNHLTNYKDNSRNLTFTYDKANRLATAHGDQTTSPTSGTGNVQIVGIIPTKCNTLPSGCDYGTVWVTVGSVTESTTYGQGDGAQSVESRLATAFNTDSQSPVTASAQPSGRLVLTSKAKGSTTNYSVGAGSVSNNPNVTSPALTATAPQSGYFSGGADSTFAPGQLSETYTIDPWGNMLPSGTLGTPPNINPNAAFSVNNRVAGFTYDAAGNLLSDGSAGFCGTGSTQYGWNAENQLICFGSYAYTYNGDGERVAKSSGTLCWGAGLAESDLSGNLTAEYIFLNGKRIARRDLPSGVVHYFLSDNLGSTDLVTDASGNIQNESDLYPYGAEHVVTQTLTPQNYKYTGKERDTESGLDYFGARYYASNMGRWTSPDWAASPTAVPYASLKSPQSLNLFAYVGNNPLRAVDPDGHDPLTGEDSCGLGCEGGKQQIDGEGIPDVFDIPEVLQAQNQQNDIVAASQQGTQAQQQNTEQAPDNTLLAQNNTPAPPGRTPAQGATPDSTVVIPDGKGGSTTRTYGPDGKAVVDVDKGHDHNGAGDPHAHDWDWGKKPPRQPARPLTPEEQKNVKRVAGGVTAGVIIYWVVSEASRILFPPRNLIPVP